MKKPWYKSKTVWAAVVTGVVGILQAVGVHVPDYVYSFLAALGLYGLRAAQGLKGKDEQSPPSAVAAIRG